MDEAPDRRPGESGDSPPGRKAAAALSYRPGEDEAPRLVAKGRGKLAERIVALARRHGVPVRHDPDLAVLLQELELGVNIPPRLYQVVAEILAFVYRVNTAWRERAPEGPRPAAARAERPPRRS